jgi:hydroxymethylbilane synthase
MLLKLRRDIKIVNLRGNVHTRLRAVGINVPEGKNPETVLDATVMAVAGLKRIGFDKYAKVVFDRSMFLPAPAQGAVVVELAEGNPALEQTVALLNHENTALATCAERTFLNVMEGGCQLPLGAFAEVDSKGVITLAGEVLSLDGSKTVKGILDGHDPEQVGRALALQLLNSGGDKILEQVRIELSEGSGS